MNKNKGGLGRGLGVIFDVERPTSTFVSQSAQERNLNEIPLTQIRSNPKQPRRDFSQEALEELASSIRTLGVIQPITVRKDSELSYTIISGERRWRASEIVGLTTIPAYIREVNDQQLHEMALVENIQREDLNPMEIAFSLQRLVEECELTQDVLASRVGKKRSTVANYLRLLSMPLEIQSALKDRYITMGHAKAIATAPEELQIPLLIEVIRKTLSVRQVEERVKKLIEEKSEKNSVEDELFPETYTKLVEHLEELFSQNISIKRGKNGGGKIVIGFDTDDDIDSLIARFEHYIKK